MDSIQWVRYRSSGSNLTRTRLVHTSLGLYWPSVGPKGQNNRKRKLSWQSVSNWRPVGPTATTPGRAIRRSGYARGVRGRIFPLAAENAWGCSGKHFEHLNTNISMKISTFWPAGRLAGREQAKEHQQQQQNLSCDRFLSPGILFTCPFELAIWVNLRKLTKDSPRKDLELLSEGFRCAEFDFGLVV